MLSKKLIYLIIVILLCINFKTITSYASSTPLKVRNLDQIEVAVKQGAKYKLPDYLLLSIDTTNKKLKVTWDTKKIDTKKEKKLVTYGIIEGHKKKFKLTINVVIWIKSINDIKQYINRNSVYQYKRYGAINAEFSNGVHKKVPVEWSIGPTKLISGHLDYVSYYGTVEGYKRKIKMMVYFR